MRPLCNACRLYRPQEFSDADGDGSSSEESHSANYMGPECGHRTSGIGRRSKSRDEPCSTRPSLTTMIQGTMTARFSGPGASLSPAVLNGNNGPGGVRVECSNYGATNDESNNAPKPPLVQRPSTSWVRLVLVRSAQKGCRLLKSKHLEHQSPLHSNLRPTIPYCSLQKTLIWIQCPLVHHHNLRSCI